MGLNLHSAAPENEVWASILQNDLSIFTYNNNIRISYKILYKNTFYYLFVIYRYSSWQDCYTHPSSVVSVENDGGVVWPG